MNETVMNILTAFLWFTALGGILGLLLAIASKVFAVKTDPRIDKIKEVLPGANCGGCGYAGCEALAEAIAKGEAKTDSCSAGGAETAAKVAEIMGSSSSEKPVRMRAQVMCSGTCEAAKKKYIYEGAHDCISACRVGGGDKACPNGCLGFGTCIAACRFDAISIKDGVAHIDPEKCTGCGACVSRCPKHLIQLIPYESQYYVECSSTEKGAQTRKFCDAGCIGCGICEKNCPQGAIKVENFLAKIDYSKCIGCGICAEKCPRKIIHKKAG